MKIENSFPTSGGSTQNDDAQIFVMHDVDDPFGYDRRQLLSNQLRYQPETSRWFSEEKIWDSGTSSPEFFNGSFDCDVGRSVMLVSRY